MRRIVQTTRRLAAGLVLVGAAHPAAAQFVAVNNYPAPAATPQAAYAAPQQQAYAAPAPGYAGPAYPQAAYPAAAAYPRVAQAAELPAPTEAINRAAGAMAAEVTPTPAAPAAPTAATYAAPATTYSTPMTTYASPAPAMSYSQPATHATYGGAASGCATGDCGTSYAAPAVDYTYGGSCDAAPACDVGVPARPRRQWFAGLYGLYLDRIGDQSKAIVGYLTDTAGFGAAAPGNYYYQPSDAALFTSDAGDDGLWGAEVRFGSTFGCDPCACTPPFAWEVGYWAIDDDSSSAIITLPGSLSAANTMRLYSMYNYYGLEADLDGAGGTTWAYRPIYTDPGDPADLDVDANDVRILGIRVRQRFQVQNLELNFWRFGTPAVAPTCGVGGGRLAGACGAGACGAGTCGVSDCGAGSCGVSPCGPGACAPAACAPCRPPRRFFINGLAGVRYMRIDDDFGLDWQQAPVDTDPTSGTYGDPPAGWPTSYTSFPADDNSVFFSDYEADNELVGFQLGCSMNWLIGCRWNLFADTNFGIYGNNADVYKRVYGGGDSVVRFVNDGSPAAVSGSETTVAYVSELRAGIGYQVTCNCRVTAAYRFFGIGGVALGAEEFQNTNWANREIASHVDANSSIILHGVQFGLEQKF